MSCCIDLLEKIPANGVDCAWMAATKSLHDFSTDLVLGTFIGFWEGTFRCPSICISSRSMSVGVDLELGESPIDTVPITDEVAVGLVFFSGRESVSVSDTCVAIFCRLEDILRGAKNECTGSALTLREILVCWSRAAFGFTVSGAIAIMDEDDCVCDMDGPVHVSSWRQASSKSSKEASWQTSQRHRCTILGLGGAIKGKDSTDDTDDSGGCWLWLDKNEDEDDDDDDETCIVIARFNTSSWKQATGRPLH